MQVHSQPINDPIQVLVNISGTWTPVNISVNEEGNLVLGGVGSVNYEMYDEELILSKWEE